MHLMSPVWKRHRYDVHIIICARCAIIHECEHNRARAVETDVNIPAQPPQPRRPTGALQYVPHRRNRSKLRNSKGVSKKQCRNHMDIFARKQRICLTCMCKCECQDDVQNTWQARCLVHCQKAPIAKRVSTDRRGRLKISCTKGGG